MVASPCATPVLTSILGFVAAAQDPALGAILLFTYTVGYSTPLLVIAASGGQALVNLQNSNVDENSLVMKGLMCVADAFAQLISFGISFPWLKRRSELVRQLR